MKCEICGRALTNQESIRLYVGPECRQNLQNGLATAGATVDDLTAWMESGIEQLQRWATCTMRAIGRGRLSDARFFINRAKGVTA